MSAKYRLLVAVAAASLAAIVAELAYGVTVYTMLLECCGMALLTPMLTSFYGKRGFAASCLVAAAALLAVYLSVKSLPMYGENAAGNLWIPAYAASWFAGAAPSIRLAAKRGWRP